MRQLAKVEIAKMRQLAGFLETIPVESFDFEHWQHRAETRQIAIGPLVLRGGCGFAGCAIGWAAHSRLFLGLRLTADEDGHLMPDYKGVTNWRAVAKLMGLNNDVSVFLFHPSMYAIDPVEPGDVADRLRKFASKVESRLARQRQANNPYLASPFLRVAA